MGVALDSVRLPTCGFYRNETDKQDCGDFRRGIISGWFLKEKGRSWTLSSSIAVLFNKCLVSSALKEHQKRCDCTK